MRFIVFLFIQLLLCSFLYGQGEKRIALLIGNGKYKYSSKLTNPRNDVDSMYQILSRELGFEVIIEKDADKASMQAALDKFERKIQASKRNDQKLVTLFYYSGHGMQDNKGQSFMLPLNANIISVADLNYRAINLQPTLDRLEEHGNFLNIIMLDACRNNPLTKSLAMKGNPGDLFEGYAPPQSQGRSGMFISFATAPGQVADSGDKRYTNSPYVLSFLQHARTPNLQLEELFRRVNKSIDVRTKRTQKPWTSSSFYDDFFFIKNYTQPDNIGKNRRVIPPNMVLVPSGSFQMGSKDGGDDEKNIHTVTLSPFIMDKTEVTFTMYDAFCDATGRKKPGDSGWGRHNRPVIWVDWYDAIEFCNWRSQQEGLQKVYTIDKSRKDPNNQNSSDDKKWLVTCNWNTNGYRLPTEAEWEYAAGGGKRQPDKWAGTNDLTALFNYANYWESGDSDQDGNKYTAPVGNYQSNALGLHDMSGNVWEWCWDWYKSDYSTIGQTDPNGPNGGENRVVRGGSWSYNDNLARVADRYGLNPDNRINNVGFRCLRAY